MAKKRFRVPDPIPVFETPDPDPVQANAPGAVVGIVSHLIRPKGCGFITGPDGLDYFFHCSALRGERFDDLAEDVVVQFIPGSGPKGLRTDHVSRA